MSTPGAIIGQVLFVAPTRTTTLIFNSIATVLALEAARRGIRLVADSCGYNPDNKVGRFIHTWTPTVITKIFTAIEPPVDDAAAKAGRGLTIKQLGIALAVCTLFTNAGWEASKWLSGGQVSSIYNRVARCLGPFVLDEHYRHPVIQYGVDTLKSYFPSLR